MNDSYFVIGYFKTDNHTSRNYFASICRQSSLWDTSEQDALRIFNKDLAIKLVEWLRKREKNDDHDWFVVENIRTGKIEIL